MKILVLNNKLDFKLDQELRDAKAYFAKYISLDFEVKNVDITVCVEEYKRVYGFDKMTGQPTQVGYMGLTDAVRKDVANVSQGGYDIVMFAYDMDKQKIPNDSIITSWTMNIPLFPKTEFVQLALNSYFKNMNRIILAITHELLHAFSFKSNRLGIFVQDEMDNTIVNGTIVPSYKNDDMYATDGNYAHTLKNLAPFFSYLNKATITKTSSAGVDFIKGLEGFSATPYRDIVGVPTIGYGSTYCACGTKVSMNTKPMSEGVAAAIMCDNLAVYEQAISKAVKVPLTQNQYDALVSLCYNIGVTNFVTSTLLKKLNAKDYKGASEQFAVWRLAGGKVSQGLINRRVKEQTLFNK